MAKFPTLGCVAVCLQLCSLVQAASLPPKNMTAPQLLYTNPFSKLNITLPTMYNSPVNFNYPVEDPFNMPSDDPNQRLRFCHFKHALPQRDIIDVLGRAFMEARANDRSANINSPQLVYHSGNVQLVFYPRVYTTWEMWRYALMTMGMFVVNKNMAFEWTFYVYLEGLDQIGHGVLKETSELEGGQLTAEQLTAE